MTRITTKGTDHYDPRPMVSQEDREAAARFGTMYDNFSSETSAAMRDGKMDNHRFVQMKARHRIAAFPSKTAVDLQTKSPAELSDDVLLFRAVSSARPVRDVRRGVPRWRAVMETFQLGSTYATALCERFRLDPEEKVRR